MEKVRVPVEYRKAVCQRLKAARKSAGYTQGSFAEKLGLEEKTYAKYESRSPLPPNYIVPACKLLDLDVYYFLDGVGRDAVRPKPRRVK